MNRRAFLCGTVAAIALAAVQPALAITDVALEQQFMVGQHFGWDFVACDWRGPHSQGEARWSMTSRESGLGSGWYPDGDAFPNGKLGRLNERARGMILEHFGLVSEKDSFPIEKLEYMSPSLLVAARRDLESRSGMEFFAPEESMLAGAHVPAALVC